MYAVTLSIHLTHDEREESNIVIEDTESILRRQRGREGEGDMREQGKKVTLRILS